MDVSEGLTRKIGPLPVWAWGGVVGGTILVVRALTGGPSGASSPFVTPIATDIPFDYDSLTGSSGGSSGGGTASPPTSSPPSANPPTPRPRSWPTKGDIVNWRARRSAPAPAPLPKRPAIDARIAGWQARRGTGDTVFSASGEGDSTPVTPTPAVPWSVPPVPLGNRLSLPALDAIPDYVGPTVDTLTPIASSARVLMPPVNGETSGSVIVPRLPKASAKADTRGARLGDSARVIQDRIAAWRRRLPTTKPDRGWGYEPIRIFRDWRNRTPTG